MFQKRQDRRASKDSSFILPEGSIRYAEEAIPLPERAGLEQGRFRRVFSGHLGKGEPLL